MNFRMKAGGFLVLGFVLASLAAPVLISGDPHAVVLGRRLLPPSLACPFGTDHLGRCVLTRVLLGGGVSLLGGAGTALMALVPGMAMGFLAGLARPGISRTIMWAADVMLAFPALIPALILAGCLGPSPASAMMGLGAVGWAWWTRFVRGQVLAAREKEYVRAAGIMGISRWRIVLHYILPQVLPPVVVYAAFQAGGMIVALSGLSYLGLGIQPPRPEWGAMLKEAGLYSARAPWMVLAPGLAITLAVLGFNLLGEGLRDRLQVRPTTGGR